MLTCWLEGELRKAGVAEGARETTGGGGREPANGPALPGEQPCPHGDFRWAARAHACGCQPLPLPPGAAAWAGPSASAETHRAPRGQDKLFNMSVRVSHLGNPQSDQQAPSTGCGTPLHPLNHFSSPSRQNRQCGSCHKRSCLKQQTKPRASEAPFAGCCFWKG